ncbi:MAG TPA: glucosaminidase domain-containing protein, partial [Bacteroidia bacterium]|nr:glucosaminidase domain-containing protein [Bacteroidia bacterium]
MRFISSPFGGAGEGTAFAQPAEYKITRPEYIEKYKDIAIREMQEHGIPASVTLAQGLLESDAGNSALAVYANNHFGIKCHKDWTGKTYI